MTASDSQSPSDPAIDLQDRYSRQALFAPIGPEGQARLARSRVAILGCGGLGTNLSSMMARAGVGRLLVVDRDRVELSNLQRQVLFVEADARAGAFKAEAAGRRLREINSEIEIETRVDEVTAANVESLVQGTDLVLDGFDNLEGRFLINDACVKLGIPWIYGACVAGLGTVMTVCPPRTPCLRCVFESMPPPGSSDTCNTVGVLASIVSVVASLEVCEALKILTGNLDAISRDLRTIDIWAGTERRVPLSAFDTGGECPACGQGRFDYLEGNR
ncbi:ThiF family adenylyltransferase [Candidatus Sumerlaeota bacterium]|nr:ThiF family adenylyltransferase [Candidatus Sumerlaeota bacterium]